MLRAKSTKEFVAVPIQVDSRGAPGEWAPETDASDARPSMFDSGDGRDSMFTPHKTRSIFELNKKSVCNFLDCWQFQVFTTLLVFYSLFAYNFSVMFEAPPSADPWIDAFLILCMVVFLVEIALNAKCRTHPPWLLLSLDLIATFTIVVDLSWVAEAAGFNETNGSRTSDAAMISARAGRIVRLVRLLRLLRTVSIFSRLAKRAMTARKAADMQASSPGGGGKGEYAAPSNIGGKLTDALVMQVALVVIVTVIATALLTSWGVEPSPFDAYVATFYPQINQTLQVLDPQVIAAREFMQDQESKKILLTVRIGPHAWNWIDFTKGRPVRPSSIALFESDDAVHDDSGAELRPPSVIMEVDISEQNAHDALLDTLIIVLVLFILLSFVTAANITIYRTLVGPLERIYYAICTHSTQLVAALGPGEVAPEDTGGVDEDGDIGTIEAAVNKLLRIVAHSATPGREGTHVARNLAIGADDSTKEWLATMVGDGVKGEASGVDEQRGEGSKEAAASVSDDKVGKTGAFGNIMHGVRNVRFSLTTTNSQSSSVAAAAALAAAQFAASGARSSDGSSSALPTPGHNSRANTGSFGVLGTSVSCAPLALEAMDAFGTGLTPEQKEALLAVDLEALHSFKFDILSVDRSNLAPHIVTMFLQLGLATFSPPQPPPLTPASSTPCSSTTCGGFVEAALLWRFIDEVSSFYRDVPYHNFHHCSDVAHSTFLLIDRLRVSAALTPIECFALMVGALAHDMDHPGVNNAFLVTARDPLALTYNDASVLENRHVACLYALVSARPDLDIFCALDTATWREVRRLVIAAVLHTDMTQHFPMVSKLEVFLELRASDIQASQAAQRNALRGRSGSIGMAGGGPAISSRASSISAFSAAYGSVSSLQTVFSTSEERTLLLSLILHCADISNPARPAEIAAKWADRVLAEFFAQGDKERAAGLPISPLCDRATTNRATSQINFVEFVVAPLFSLFARIFPDVGELMENTVATRQYWQAAALDDVTTGDLADGKSPEEKEKEVQKAEGRMVAFMEKYKEAISVSARRRRDVKRRLSTIPQGGSGFWSEGPSARGASSAAKESVNIPFTPVVATSTRISMASSQISYGSRMGSGTGLSPRAGSPMIAPEHSDGSINNLGHTTNPRSRSASMIPGKASKAVATAIMSRARSLSGRWGTPGADMLAMHHGERFTPPQSPAFTYPDHDMRLDEELGTPNSNATDDIV